jgi:hypothetical protein
MEPLQKFLFLLLFLFLLRMGMLHPLLKPLVLLL